MLFKNLVAIFGMIAICYSLGNKTSFAGPKDAGRTFEKSFKRCGSSNFFMGANNV